MVRTAKDVSLRSYGPVTICTSASKLGPKITGRPQGTLSHAWVPPYCYGVDPRTLPGATGFDLSKYANSKEKSATTSSVCAGADAPKHASPTSSSATKRPHAEPEGAEVLDLSVKKRKMEEQQRTLEKEATLHKDTLCALGRMPGVPPTNGMLGHPHAQFGLPMGYPPMWDLGAFQPGAAPSTAVTAAATATAAALPLPGLTPPAAYLPLANKDRLEVNGVPSIMNPYGLPHLPAPCTSMADRERLFAHLRL